MKKKEEDSAFYDTYKKIRRDWGEVNPVSRTFKDKKKYSRKQKHKNSEEQKN